MNPRREFLKYLNINLEVAKSWFELCGGSIIDGSEICRIDKLTLDTVEWLHGVKEISQAESSIALHRMCMQKIVDFQVLNCLADIGANMNALMIRSVNLPLVADWIIERFKINQDVLLSLNLLSNYMYNYEMAIWALERSFVSENEITCWKIVSALDSGCTKFVEICIDKYNYRVAHNTADTSMRKAILRNDYTTCEWILTRFGLDPAMYGLPESFGTLGPKSALKTQ